MKRRSFKFFQSIYFKIPFLFIFILLISFQFIGVFFIDQLETQTISSYKNQISTQTDFLVNNLRPILQETEGNDDERIERINHTLETFTSTMPTRIIVINSDETVIASDSTATDALVGTQASSPAARNVLLTLTSYSTEIREAETGDHIYHLVKPITNTQQSQALGAVAIEANLEQAYEQTNNTIDLFIQSALLAVGVALVVSIFLSQGLTRPIENIRQQAIRISEGVYNYPAEIYGQDELGELAITINELAVKVKDAQDSMESERQRLDGILRHMTDGVIGTDQRGNVLLVNNRALYYLDIRQDQALSQSIFQLLGVQDEYVISDFLDGDKEILLTRDSPGDAMTTILKGEFSVIRRETGFVTGLVCVLTDVTEQEKTDQERRNFVSNVSHELRTPLTSLKSYSEALADGAWQDPNLAPQFIDVIQSESNRMIRMIANLLDLSKIDGGQIKLDKDYVNFKRIVNHILDRVEFTMASEDADKHYEIKRDFTSREIYVDIDQDRMTQVIDNLLNNAIKYSPDGGTITVSIRDNHQSVIFSVRDEGIGISQADMEHLFERFYRVDKARSREQGGSGLGLAISKEVVELHGGNIWVESVEGEGSVFNFELPYTSFDDIEEEWI
ncbi:cell wall metabolism sensor histidine kinase WalK [Suicoccus acidiformans]|uniref:histidine kinase n=1 Tax=Suicoccus acidiformans TaxID=2036206 RepID=A0A347WHV4_9LACT|nr:cell wall metabolism sensor histidine kinase WalK [Suicoccus acidiformans]AXY24661.1 cell wall metabolism sensor histidine kinase WalK [Suicoccus acidiformans]